ncbi:hypothetical protein BCON_0214g00060 [Botryotinia convoluta]|uniref:Uncharacterized protein n=1 Tax=Botryotinia convoluta TaxID=54673 RepID=A0A4Z1HKW2_9HELO|nr:hypothetical protein BCON_0214g00060 [Botryotinia convoluta]
MHPDRKNLLKFPDSDIPTTEKSSSENEVRRSISDKMEKIEEGEFLDSGSEKDEDEITDSFQKCTKCRKLYFRPDLSHKQKDNVLCKHCQAVPNFHRRKSGPTSASSLPPEFQADDAKPIQKRSKSRSPVLLANSSAPKIILPSAADLPPFLGLQTPETQSCERTINFDPRPIPLSFDDPKSPDRRSQVPDMPVASIDASYPPTSNASFDQDAYQDASKDEPSSMELDNNISSPSSLIAQSKQGIALKPSPLKSQPVVSEKKNLRKEIDLTDETSDKKKSKEELEWESAGHDLSIRSCVATSRIGKYSDRAINEDSLFLTLLDQKWDRLRMIDPIKAFLFKSMKAKSQSVPDEVDAPIPSLQDSDLPLEHFQKLITISQISTCAKKNKIGAEIAQVRCDFELHNSVEEAGMSVDPTPKSFKQGNPIDIQKGLYYEKLAKVNFLRAGGNLATCTERNLKPFLDDCRKQKRIGIKIAQLVDSFDKGVLFLYQFFIPELQKGERTRPDSRNAKAFEPHLHELSNDLDIEALLKELDRQDLHPENLEDSRYQQYSSDNDEMEELFEEFPETSSVFYKGTSSNPGLTIFLEDLQIFAEGTWLSDTVDLYLLRSSNLEIFNNKPKEADKSLRRMYIDSIKGPGLYFNQVLCVKAFASHWTTQLAQITTPVGPKATVLITIKVWDSLDNEHTPTLDFQRWSTEIFMLGEDPKTVKCSVQRMNSMQQLNLDDCGIIALHNAIAIYDGEADTEMFSEEWSRQERYRFCSMVVQHAKKLYQDSRI